jgi:hypothetical protein
MKILSVFQQIAKIEKIEKIKKIEKIEKYFFDNKNNKFTIEIF